MLGQAALPPATAVPARRLPISGEVALLAAISAVTVIYLVLLATDTVGALRGNVQWHIPYVAQPSNASWWLPVIPGLVVAALPLLPIPAWATISVAAAATCAFVYALFAAQWGGGDNLMAKIINEPTAFHRAAGQIMDLRSVLANYPQYLAQFELGSHVRSHPPGDLLLFRWLEDVMSAHAGVEAATLNWGKTFISGLPLLLQSGNAPYLMASAIAAIPLITGLGRLAAFPLAATGPYLGIEPVAPTLLLLVLPTVLVHIPLLDTVYPLLTALVVLAGVAAIERRSWVLALSAGILFALSLFFSASLLLIALPLVVYGLLRLRWRAVWLGLAAAAGGAAIWAILWLGWRINMPAIMQYLADHQRDFEATRSYWLWFRWKWYDFVMFCGIPVAALSLKFLIESARRWRLGMPTKLDYFFVGWLAMIIWLWLTPAALAEGGRLWAPLMCFAVLFAAAALPRFRGALSVVLLLELAQTIVMNRYLEVINSG